MNSKTILSGSAAILLACAFTLSTYAAETAAPAAATPAAPSTEPAKPASDAPKAEKKDDKKADKKEAKADKPKNTRGNPADRVNKMKEALNLTDDQAAKILVILQESAAKAKEARKSGDKSPEAHKANRQEAFQKINAVLTPEQQTKWHEELRKGREAKPKAK